MRIVVASDKFKGSVTSLQVAEHLARGIHRIESSAQVRQIGIGDGGDGTLAALTAAGFTRHKIKVTGPTGEPVHSGWASRGDVAVVELADTCGTQRLPDNKLQPWRASSDGFGQAIAEAMKHRPKMLILGVGGSASTDGGAGMLTALGARLLDKNDQQIPPGLAGLEHIDHVDFSQLVSFAGTKVILATDVSNRLLGKQGAAAVFGPQKGLARDDLRIADQYLAKWASIICSHNEIAAQDRLGSGAAGGVGFAAIAALNAEVRLGIDVVLEQLDFAHLIKGCDVVITGEGKFDQQSFAGKAIVGVTSYARSAGIPVIVVCGVNLVKPSQWKEYGIAQCYAIRDLVHTDSASYREVDSLLEMVGENIALELGRAQPRFDPVSL